MLKPRASRRELLDYTKKALMNAGVKPSKRLGQHFLIDPRGVDFFIEGLEGGGGGRRLLEIGPGLGVLTLSVSQIAEAIVAVEIHPRLASFLSRVVPENVLVVRGDGLQAASATRLESVYSNTPFNISASLVIALAKNNNVRDAVLGVQLEVAERLAASPGSESYGRLSVAAQRVFRIQKLGVMPPEFFYPPPEVYGAVVRLERLRPWSEEDDAIEAIARCLFTGRNKRVAKMVRRCYGAVLEQSRLAEKRVRELTPAELEELYRMLADGGFSSTSERSTA